MHDFSLTEMIQAAPYFDPAAPVIDWSEPKPIKTELSPVLELDPQIIPEPFREWITDAAYRKSAPIDGMAVAAIVTASSVIGTGCTIRPKRKDNWTVVPNLWGALIGDPSTMKSSQLLEGTEPLKVLEQKANDDYNARHREYQIEYQLFKNRQQGLTASVRSTKGAEDIDNVRATLKAMQEPCKPAWKRYQTNDASVEKLNELLSENPRGIQIFRDELTGFLASMEMQGHEADRAYYLEGWNGNGTKTDDRIGRGTIIAPNVCISILGGIQPQKLEKYLYDAAYGLGNDGFIQRFQLMVYPDPMDFAYVDEPPNTKARERAFEVFDRLAMMDFTIYGATKTEADKFPYMHFTDEAQQLYVDWLIQHKAHERCEQSVLIKEHLSKYASLMPSLALVFHLIEIADGVTAGAVTERSIRNAIAWCEYLESHARRIYGLVAHIGIKAASVLAEKIRKGEIADAFTSRDVQRKGWRFLTETEVIRQALDELTDLDWLHEQRTQPAFQQKSKSIYFINPAVRQKNV